MKIDYIPSLDGIRAFSVGLVLASHAGLSSLIPGGLGVTIFFFLSGYLISTLLVSEFQTTGRINFRNFFLRRLFRLFPPLLITLLLAYLLLYLGYLGGGASWGGLSSQIFYFANYYQLFSNHTNVVPNGLGILWSLAVEEHFYLFYPLFILLALSRLPRFQRTVTLILFSVCLLVLSWRCYLFLHDHAPIERIYYATDTRIDSILFGCILALACNPLNHNERRSLIFADFSAMIFGAILLVFTLVYRDEVFRETLRYSLQGVALMPLFYYAIAYPNFGPFRILNNPTIQRVGIYSYSIYLIHYVLLKSLEITIPAIPTWFSCIICAALSIVYAIAIDRWVDPYFRNLRRKLRSKAASSAGAASEPQYA